MRRRRSNAGLFQRLLEGGSRSTSHREELQRRRTAGKKEARAEAMRQRERDREELARERQQIRDANRLKRKLLKAEQAERRTEAAREKERKAEERESRISAAAIQRAYDRGAKTLGEAMEMAQRGNPRGSKGDFSRCVKAVSQRKGAKDPEAICAAQERKRGLLNPAFQWDYLPSGYLRIDVEKKPTREEWREITGFVKSKGVHAEVRNAKTGHKYDIVSPNPAAQERKRGLLNSSKRLHKGRGQRQNAAGDTFHVPGLSITDLSAIPDLALYYTKAEAADVAVSLGWRRSDARRLRLPFGRARWVISDSHHNVVTAQGARNLRRSNPADAAMAVSEEFHGRKVKAMIPVSQKRHYHKYLAELGELRKLEVLARDGKHRVTLSKFDGAMLCTNEDKNQLFLVGGDQGVDLRDFGIKDAHETETLGEVTKIEYFTDKEHLGSEGGEAVYVHKFRTTNGGRGHQTVRLARNPDLIYYLRDEHLEFSGGSYFIRAEGIDL